MLVPAGLALVAAVGFYSVAVSHSVLDRATFDQIAVGTPRAELAGVLPGRQVWDRPAAPSGASCEFYTDGNFPLARATYRLCFDAGRLAAKDRLG